MEQMNFRAYFVTNMFIIITNQTWLNLINFIYLL